MWRTLLIYRLMGDSSQALPCPSNANLLLVGVESASLRPQHQKHLNYQCCHCESWQRLPISFSDMSCFSATIDSTYRPQRSHHNFKLRWVSLSRTMRSMSQRLIHKSIKMKSAVMLGQMDWRPPLPVACLDRWSTLIRSLNVCTNFSLQFLLKFVECLPH